LRPIGIYIEITLLAKDGADYSARALGFLLRKHPDQVHTKKTSLGDATIFYPEICCVLHERLLSMTYENPLTSSPACPLPNLFAKRQHLSLTFVMQRLGIEIISPQNGAYLKGLFVASCLLILGLSLSAEAEESGNSTTETSTFDIEAGAAQYKMTCRRCHGPTAKGLASFPKLAGQSQEYLSDRLERYRKGEKLGPNTGLMAPVAKELSDQDILDITHFITSIS